MTPAVSPAVCVTVNLLWLAPGRVGGSEQYLVRQLGGVPDDGSLRVRLVVQPAFVAAYPELCERFEVELQPWRRDWRGARILAEHTWLRVITRPTAPAGGGDLTHHGGGTAPVGCRRPYVLTVHDLQYRRYPQYFSAARRGYLQAMMPRSVERATIVAVPSDYVRATLIDAFDCDPSRVVTVPHGVPAPKCTPDASERARRQLGLGSHPYVVYPAITHPHKRHDVLVEMLDHVDVIGDRLRLVLIGGQGAADDDVRAAIARSPHGDRVVRAGRVPDATRDALLAGASALVFPSEYEGFGAPLVEAMQLGVPVVCCDDAAIGEVVADAAVLVAERTGRQFAAGVASALADADRLATAGRRRAEAFTIERSGEALAAAYRLAATIGTP